MIPPKVTNLLEGPSADRELFFELLQTGPAKLERIVSNGHASEPGFWYEQPQPEWVLLLKGEATLEFEDGAGLALKAGDSLIVHAHCRHRVASVSQDAIWLALHYQEP